MAEDTTRTSAIFKKSYFAQIPDSIPYRFRIELRDTSLSLIIVNYYINGLSDKNKLEKRCAVPSIRAKFQFLLKIPDLQFR